MPAYKESKPKAKPPTQEDARSRYFKDLSKVKILSVEVEREVYAQYAASGFTDMVARDRLVEGCLRLVVTRAAKYSSSNPSMLDELISAGNEGLIKALEKYDPTKGTRIPSYAIWWIDLYIRNTLSESHPVKVPMWRQKKGVKLRRLRNAGKTTEEMAEACNLSIAQVEELEKSRYHSAELTSANIAGSMDYVRSVADHDFFKAVDVEADSVEESAKKVLNEVVSELTDEEQVIIRSYYGLGRKPLNLPQLAETKGVTSERVRQIKNKLLTRLRSAFKRRGINSIDDLL
jgi:RNA polymerase primary sigma factor